MNIFSRSFSSHFEIGSGVLAACQAVVQPRAFSSTTLNPSVLRCLISCLNQTMQHHYKVRYSHVCHSLKQTHTPRAPRATRTTLNEHRVSRIDQNKSHSITRVHWKTGAYVQVYVFGGIYWRGACFSHTPVFPPFPFSAQGRNRWRFAIDGRNRTLPHALSGRPQL